MFAMLDLNLKEVQNTNGPSVLRVVYRLDSSDETVMRILCQAPAVNRLTYITSVTWPTFNAYWVLSAFDWIMFCSITILDDFVVISCSSGLSFWRKVTLRRDIMWNYPKLPSYLLCRYIIFLKNLKLLFVIKTELSMTLSQPSFLFSLKTLNVILRQTLLNHTTKLKTWLQLISR